MKSTAVLFDIDNVLIDTRTSYLDAIRWTIEIYLTHDKIPLFAPLDRKSSPYLLSSDDIEAFKLLGGFNDDWDCCYGLLVYLLNLPVQKRTLQALKEKINIQAFAEKTTARPLGVSGITRMLGRPTAVMIEKISRIFQEVYLGKDLFREVERKNPIYWKKLGLIHNEKLIFKKSLLAQLTKKGITLGIATGRPRFEAVYILKHFGVLDFFQAMTTIDEVKSAEKQ